MVLNLSFEEYFLRKPFFSMQDELKEVKVYVFLRGGMLLFGEGDIVSKALDFRRRQELDRTKSSIDRMDVGM